MQTLKSMRTQVKEHPEDTKAKRIIIFGPPKAGKTVMAATIAKLPWIKRVYWFDNEQSIDSLVDDAADIPDYIRLTDEEAEKIIVINVQDTPDMPTAADTALKVWLSNKKEKICQNHGRLQCKECKPTDPWLEFNIKSLTHEDALVIDSGSQLGDSLYNAIANAATHSNIQKYYGDFKIDMSNIMMMLQAARCQVVMVTHEQDIDKKTGENQFTTVEHVPLCGSRPYSKKMAKYFTHPVYMRQKDGHFIIGTGPRFQSLVKIANRTGIRMENLENATLVDIYNPVRTKESIESKSKPGGIVLGGSKPKTGLKKQSS